MCVLAVQPVLPATYTTGLCDLSFTASIRRKFTSSGDPKTSSELRAPAAMPLSIPWNANADGSSVLRTPTRGRSSRQCLSDSFKQNVAKQAWLRCYSKEAAVVGLSRASRAFASEGPPGTPPPRLSAAGSHISDTSTESEAPSVTRSAESAGASGNGQRKRRASLAVTADMAAMLQAQLQQRMFGARQGNYAHSDAAALLLARRVQGVPLSLRERMFLFLEEPVIAMRSSP